MSGAAEIPYKRVLLKLSGEALSGEASGGVLDYDVIRRLARDILEAAALGVEVGLVVGGGNILRGRAAGRWDRVQADHIGMVATVINALALQDACESLGGMAHVMSALPAPYCESFSRRRAMALLRRKRIVIFAGGTGSPAFTTDTAAALRAMEIGAEALFKATLVDGVYSEDPKRNPRAERYDHLTYGDVLAMNLQVMDAAAIRVCRDSGVIVVVFSIKEAGGFARALSARGERTSIAAE